MSMRPVLDRSALTAWWWQGPLTPFAALEMGQTGDGEPLRSATVTVEGRHAAYGHAGDGPSILFLPTCGLTFRAYQRSLRRLTAVGFRVLTPSLPGFGGTADLPPPVELAGYAAWVASFLDALGEDEPMVVIGHGFGAAVGVALAEQAPDRVGYLVLLDVASATAGPSMSMRPGAGGAWTDRLVDGWKQLLPFPEGLQALQTAALDATLNLTANTPAVLRAAGVARRGGVDATMATLRRRRLPLLSLANRHRAVIPDDCFRLLATVLTPRHERLGADAAWLSAPGEVATAVRARLAACGTADPTGTEPTGTEPSATEPSATEPTGTEPTGTEPSATEPTGATATTSGSEPTDATEPTGAGEAAIQDSAAPRRRRTASAEVRARLAGTDVPAAFVGDLLSTASPLWLLTEQPDALAGDLALCHPPLAEGEVRALARPVIGARSGAATVRLTVLATDRAGLLADTAAALAVEGHSVTAASACSWPDEGLALHALTFEAAGPLGPDQWEALGKRLHAVGRARRRPQFQPIGTAMVTVNGSSGGDTVVEITAPDTVGLLWAVCRWFADHDLTIVSATATTTYGMADDVFVVQGGRCDAAALAAHLSPA